MEVAKIQGDGIRLKSKLATFAINPFNGKGKLAVDAILLFAKNIANTEIPTEAEALLIQGPGEYEIKGVKLNGQSKTGEVVYTGKIDGIDVTILRASVGQKSKDAVQECNVAIIEADVVLEQSILSALNANVVLIYGPQAQESIKAIGKQSAPMSKYSITKDKLPAEMELILLE